MQMISREIDAHQDTTNAVRALIAVRLESIWNWSLPLVVLGKRLSGPPVETLRLDQRTLARRNVRDALPRYQPTVDLSQILLAHFSVPLPSVTPGTRSQNTYSAPHKGSLAMCAVTIIDSPLMALRMSVAPGHT